MNSNQPVVSVEHLKAELCKRSFYYFVQTFWEVIIAEVPIWNWHIEYLCNEAQDMVERIASRQIKMHDVIINIPPGTSKSTIFTIMLPAWAWAIDPTLRILTISYSDMLATEHAVKSRDIIRSEKYKNYFPYIEVKKDKDNKTNYENTTNGQRMAAGLSGTITGIHAHLILIDDPLNPKQAASETECTTANMLIDSTLSTRKVDKQVTVTLLIMQRLSANDPTAHLLSKQKSIKHICLPAEAMDDVLPIDLKNKYVDGLLDPYRLSKPILQELRIDLGTAGYAGQIAQRPAQKGGSIWQKWFKEVPDHLFPDKNLLQHYGTDWDLAYTKDDTNAASAYISAGKLKQDIYIDDLGWDWLEFPALINLMKNKPSPHYIEAKASGKSAKQTLVTHGIPAMEVKVEGGDKIARANMATPVAEAGMVYIRQSLADTLYHDARQGILLFPSSKYKDLADVLAQCLQRLVHKSRKLIISDVGLSSSLLDELSF